MSDKTGWLDTLLRALDHVQFVKLAFMVLMLGLILLLLPSSTLDLLSITPYVNQYRGVIALATIVAAVALFVDLAFRLPGYISSKRWSSESEKQRHYEDTLALLELPEHHHAMRVIQYCLVRMRPKI